MPERFGRIPGFGPQPEVASLFLKPEDIAMLTGIRGGSRGKTREQRQVAILNKQKIPYFLNAAGRPVVTRSSIEGGKVQAATIESWEPGVFQHG